MGFSVALGRITHPRGRKGGGSLPCQPKLNPIITTQTPTKGRFGRPFGVAGGPMCPVLNSKYSKAILQLQKHQLTALKEEKCGICAVVGAGCPGAAQGGKRFEQAWPQAVRARGKAIQPPAGGLQHLPGFPVR